MKKTDKKLEKVLIAVLTRVCEQALTTFDGFQWLTHTVNFNNVPRTLKITCVFETRDQVSVLLDSPLNTFQSQSCDISNTPSKRSLLSDLIQHELIKADLYLVDKRTQIKFDSEEACHDEHQGKWNRRLS